MLIDENDKDAKEISISCLMGEGEMPTPALIFFPFSHLINHSSQKISPNMVFNIPVKLI